MIAGVCHVQPRRSEVDFRYSQCRPIAGGEDGGVSTSSRGQAQRIKKARPLPSSCLPEKRSRAGGQRLLRHIRPVCQILLERQAGLQEQDDIKRSQSRLGRIIHSGYRRPLHTVGDEGKHDLGLASAASRPRSLLDI